MAAWPLARNKERVIPMTLSPWVFELSNGSFTANSSDPWGTGWLNEGRVHDSCVCSLQPMFFAVRGPSLVGLLFKNGPIQILSNYSAAENQYAWSTVTDHVWIDQLAVSTVGANGYVPSVPSLAMRPLYLADENYAGTNIPSITKTYLGMDHFPVDLARIAIGDGTLVPLETVTEIPVITVLEI
ncbi:hypothetical protein HD554DRAFT_810697 [Boletus coccyginus]|nr:hypothetical protein HD554DRAFT_810697 [Boletus coccyginus]